MLSTDPHHRHAAATTPLSTSNPAASATATSTPKTFNVLTTYQNYNNFLRSSPPTSHKYHVPPIHEQHTLENSSAMPSTTGTKTPPHHTPMYISLDTGTAKSSSHKSTSLSPNPDRSHNFHRYLMQKPNLRPFLAYASVSSTKLNDSVLPARNTFNNLQPNSPTTQPCSSQLHLPTIKSLPCSALN